jgi:hypothetical protein
MIRNRYIIAGLAGTLAVVAGIRLAGPITGSAHNRADAISEKAPADAISRARPSAQANPASSAARPSLKPPTTSVPDSTVLTREQPAMDFRDPDAREIWAAKLHSEARRDYERAQKKATALGLPVKGTHMERSFELAAIKRGRIYMRSTRNVYAGTSTGADLLQQGPYNLKGDGQRVGVWDAGAVRASHQEFTGRVTVNDPVANHFHSSHVAGTVGATGIAFSAKGMAPLALIESYDWNSDTAEMAANAMATAGEANKLQLSNHSYGFEAGWSGNQWFGTWGNRESDSFGMYDVFAAQLDAIAYAAPYYLYFKAAGNDRNDTAPNPGTTFTYFDGVAVQSKAYDPATDPFDDNWDNGGYDTVPLEATAKNIISIGAVNDATLGLTRNIGSASMSSFSVWGPTDDGRIKPDVVANGVALTSCGNNSDNSVRILSGTSMASPNAMGTAALMLEHYGRLFPGSFMRASTIKGLIIHTADDIGNPGPDYQNGWGLVNGVGAIEHLDRHAANTNAHRLVEDSVSASNLTRRYTFLWDRESPIRATLCWTDPPGAEKTALDDATPNLVHDLDMRITSAGSDVYMPFVMSATNPSAVATFGDNNVDNIEQIIVTNPTTSGEYELEVTLDGSLQENEQSFSLLLSGAMQPPIIQHTPLQNTANTSDPYGVEVQVHSEFLLDDDYPVHMGWNTTGPGALVTRAAMLLVSNGLYRGEIPAQDAGTRVYYYIRALTENGAMSLEPPGAPLETHRFSVVESFFLLVSGSPSEVGTVDPGYGVAVFPSGIVVRASADYYTDPINGTRDVNRGWRGLGSIPESGNTNSLEITIQRTSSLEWQWEKAHHLAQTSTPPGIVEFESWWVEGTTGETLTAISSLTLSGSNYVFAGWYIDGMRWPNDNDVAQNPAANILMTGPKQALARYLPENQDLDNDTVADWWEYFYLGSTGVALNIDLDDDGFSNLGEFRDRSNPQDGASVPIPPAIAHTPILSPQAVPAPWPATAIVTDNHEVDAVTIEWNRNGEGWQSEAMTLTEAPDTYSNAIPAPGVTGDQIQYRIIARDPAGLQSINGLYTIDVGYPVIMLSPLDIGTVHVKSNAQDGVVITVANDGHANLDWTANIKAAGFMDDVESGENGWTHAGQNDAWHVSSVRAYSGSNAWYFGSDSTLQYPNSAKAWLDSPQIYIASNSVFSFQHWLDTEALKDPQTAWDGALIELSTDDGESYHQVNPTGDYPYVIYGHPAAAFSNGTPCLAGDGEWERLEFDLGAYAGKLIRLRLHFGSDGFVVSEGWHVDDLKVAPYGGPDDWVLLNITNGSVVPQSSAMPFAVISGDTIAPSETRRGVFAIRSNDPLKPLCIIPVAAHNPTRLIHVFVSGSGSVNPSGAVVTELGATENFIVAAATYHHIDDVLTNGNSVGLGPGMVATNVVWENIEFDGSGSLNANFLPNRTTNGVTEFWLAANGLTNAAPDIEAMGDQDLDDLLTWEEFIAGTDPNDAGSVWRVTALTYIDADAAHVISWPSVSNRNYRLYCSTNVFEPLTLIDPAIPATPPENSYTNPHGGQASAVYAVGVELIE